MKTALTSVLLAIALASPALGAELEGTLKKIRDTKTIVMGHREASRPFSFLGPDGRPAGYSVDLCTRVAAGVQQQLGLPDLQIKWVPVTRRTGSAWWPMAASTWSAAPRPTRSPARNGWISAT